MHLTESVTECCTIHRLSRVQSSKIQQRQVENWFRAVYVQRKTDKLASNFNLHYICKRDETLHSESLAASVRRGNETEKFSNETDENEKIMKMVLSLRISTLKFAHLFRTFIFALGGGHCLNAHPKCVFSSLKCAKYAKKFIVENLNHSCHLLNLLVFFFLQ